MVLMAHICSSGFMKVSVISNKLTGSQTVRGRVQYAYIHVDGAEPEIDGKLPDVNNGTHSFPLSLN